MVRPTNGALGALLILGLAIGAPGVAFAQVVCETDEAQSVIQAREAARQQKAEDLQRSIDETTGSVDTRIIADNCVADAFSGGLGASISMPSVSGIIGAIGDQAYDAFCGVVDDAVRGVDDRIEETTDPINDVPGVESDAGLGGGNPNDGSGISGGTNDVTDDVAEGVDDAVFDEAVDQAEDEVLDGLY